ncbi:MAG TPA: DUF2922 domain-containing protein [Verrucomicrobiae bacterium]|nr:DUF2922 domain-containing protein [Verrucomicrobiae bacterium]
MLTKRLEMIFQNAAGKNVTIAVAEPKEGITADEVKTAMESIIAGNYFRSTGGDLTAVVGARISSRDSNELAVK